MHLTDDTVEQLLKAEISGSERKQAVRHLLLGCEECRQRARSTARRLGVTLASDWSGEEAEIAYNRVFDRVATAAVATLRRLQDEKAVAAGLWASLQEHPPARRLDVVATDPRMQTWGLYNRLMEIAREITPTEPERALGVSELAVAVADRLDPATYTEARVNDLQAAALALRGNCKRVLERFDEAEADLDRASVLLRKGTGDPLERAALLSYQGSLLTDLGSYEKAWRVLDRAVRLYTKAGDEARMGRTMLQQATAAGYIDPAKAVEILEEAGPFIDPVHEPLLELSCRHSLALFLNDAGRTAEALEVLEDSRGLYRRFPEQALRLAWLEGKIERNLENLAEAGTIFERVAADFLARSQFQEHLLASLDLAEVCYAQGDRKRTLEICTGLQHALESWNMHAEGLATMMLFVSSLRGSQVEQSAFLQVAQTLRRGWNRSQRLS
jgi:tetratricopeptide (TPR) repeat protein